MGLFSWLKKEQIPATSPGGIEVRMEARGLFVLNVRGVVTPAVLAEAQRKILALAAGGDRIRGLVDGRAFQGFAKGFDGGMTDIEKMASIDEILERMAIVADERWHGSLKLFLLAGMRKPEMKVFAAQQMSEARAWLER